MDPNQMIGTLWVSKFVDNPETCLILDMVDDRPIVLTNNHQFYTSSIMIDEWKSNGTKWRMIK